MTIKEMLKQQMIKAFVSSNLRSKHTQMRAKRAAPSRNLVHCPGTKNCCAIKSAGIQIDGPIFVKKNASDGSKIPINKNIPIRQAGTSMTRITLGIKFRFPWLFSKIL